MRRETYSSFDVSEILEVNPSTVTRWIKQGKIRAFTTGGGHYRIKKDDLEEFADAHDIRLHDDRKKKILVIDDDPSILNMIRKSYRKMENEVSVLTAEDGFSGGRMFEEHNPHVVIIDIMLPGINGIQVCREIRKKEIRIKSKRIRIIAITAYPSESNIHAIMAAGADTLLVKPFDIEALHRYVNEVL